MTNTEQKTCSRGHTFYKSSDCPMCPRCWPGYYKEKNSGDFPNDLSTPALRALLDARIFNLEQLAKHSEAKVLELHGMGPSSMPLLRQALKEKELSFRDN